MIFVIVGGLLVVGVVTFILISDPALDDFEQDNFPPED